MKLAILYSIFNGEELLEDSIKQVYDHVDHIVICYQNLSNKGELRTDLYDNLQHFAENDKVRLLNWEPDMALTTKANELHKHNAMITCSKVLNCTHFVMAAADHYYKPDEFEKAKDKIENSIFDVTLTAMYTYYKHPTWQLTPIENYYMPFICKLYPHTAVENCNFPVRVDPSVQINTCKNWYLFNEDEIMLHHYSMIRKDIVNKFKNAAASIRWTQDQVKSFIDQYENYDIKINPGIEYFSGRKIVIKENWAGLK